MRLESKNLARPRVIANSVADAVSQYSLALLLPPLTISLAKAASRSCQSEADSEEKLACLMRHLWQGDCACRRSATTQKDALVR